MKSKIILLDLFLVSAIACNNPPKNQNITPNRFDSPKKIELDSLISYGNNIKDDRIKLGNLYNLDVIYGFRGLKFKTDPDSIDFSNGAKFDNKYLSKGILILRDKNVNAYAFGNGDELELTFFRNKLSRIQISNSRISETTSYKQQQQFNTQLEDLIDLFGTPTTKFPIIKGRFQKILEERDAKNGLSVFNTDVGWNARKVSLRYKRYWKIETLELLPTDYLRYEDSKIYYSLNEYEKIIQESIKLIDDSLIKVHDKENMNEREKDLRKRF